MTRHIAIESLKVPRSRRELLSRRQVMIGAAGLTFAVALGVDLERLGPGRRGEERAGEDEDREADVGFHRR